MKTGKQRARERVMQALYQWKTTSNALLLIEQEFLERKDLSFSKSFFKNTLRDIPTKLKILEESIQKALERPLVELGAVEYAILILGTYELTYSPSVPYRVVINEAVGLAKNYAGEGAFRLVNSALDKIASTVRMVEVEAS